MYRVIVSTTCGCIVKNNIPNKQLFESKDEAVNEANILLKQMNEEFCQKHKFAIVEIASDVLITRQSKH